MKTILPIPLALLFLLLVGIGGSCKSTPASYATLAVTQDLTVGALQEFGKARVQGKVSEAQFIKINTVYKKYQTAYDAALTTAQLDVNSATPAEVKQLAGEFAAAVAAVVGGSK